jgi:hypothetical protein
MSIGRQAPEERLQQLVKDIQTTLHTAPRVQFETHQHDLILRVWEAVQPVQTLEEAERLLGYAGVSAADLAPISAALHHGEVTPPRLLEVLSTPTHGTDAWPVPLGLLILHLARLVHDRADRQRLQGLLAEHRLIPGLNRRAWYERQQRPEIALHYEHDRLHGLPAVTAAGPAPPTKPVALAQPALLKLLVEQGEQIDNWQRTVSVVGEALWQMMAAAPELLRLLQSSYGGVCLATTMANLTVPFEWMPVEANGEPICLKMPVWRYILDRPATSPPLDLLLGSNVAMPPRVLLVGYNPRDLPSVDEELHRLYAVFQRCYQALRWPTARISLLQSTQATPQSLLEALHDDDYQLVHVAGHADVDASGEAFLQLCPPAGAPLEHGRVSGTALQACLADTQVRFMYLNCCRSAAAPGALAPSFGRQQSLCDAVLRAGVGEVLAYVWAVDDAMASNLAWAFYATYLQHFDAARALHQARRQTPHEARIWAAPLLVRQGDFAARFTPPPAP